MQYKVRDVKYDFLVQNIEDIFAKEDSTLFQKRNTVKCVEYDTILYAVKSFKIPHLFNQIMYRFFRSSKAERSYENAVKLRALGVNTPEPIGYIELASKFLFQKSYYVSEFYDFDFEIRDVLNDDTFEDREEILKEFVYFSNDLHDKGVYHSDYSPGNVIIKKLNDGYEFSIIDVNRMKFVEYDDALRCKNLSRFSTSDEDLAFIALEYANLASMDESFAVRTLQKYHDAHQNYLRRKRKLKALKS
jgi:tRNA A-37 threonylcarbamoyl transferase component Bud32